MTLSLEDRLAIHELVALHGHLMDDGALDQLSELFTDDVRYDLSAYGLGVLGGIDAVVSAARQVGDTNPLAHHVTNVVVVGDGPHQALARSKGLGIASDGTAGSVVYDDVVRRTINGWRIAERTVTPRRRPLQP